MNALCSCIEAGFCTRHQIKKTDREHKLCQGVADTPDGGLKYWNAWEQGELGATAPDNPKIDPLGFSDGEWLPDQTVMASSTKVVVSAISKIGDRLKQIIERETGTGIPCGECKSHILKLNSMAVAKVKESRAEIIKQIADRAKDKAPKFWQRLAVTVDQALHIGETERRIGKWLDESIEIEKRSAPAKQPKARHHRPAVAPKGSTGPAVSAVKFTEPVRRNLLYHIYPMRKSRDVWQWNLDQLIRRIDLFTGKRIVGIVHDKLSDPPEMVKEYLRGYVDDFVVLPNVKKRGEGVTFGPMMEKIESFDANEITFRAHAKGVTMRSRKHAPTLQWTEIMYGACLDDWQLVKSQLSNSAITGPFRRHHRIGTAAWFFAGSFYWFRNRDVFQCNWRNIQRGRVGIEMWPGDLFKIENSACLFDDKAGSLYNQKYIDDRALPKYQEWMETHLPNRVIVAGRNQHPRWMSQRELPDANLDDLYRMVSITPSDISEHCTTLKELASRCESVTEFGTRYGVSTIALLAGRPAKMTSYDIERKETVAWIESAVEKTDYRFVLGDTLKIDAIEPTDLLFIDTLHTIEQLRAELTLHGNQAKKYIAFHDTSIGAGRGLRVAINEFITANPEWSIKADFQNNNAFMVLGK